MRPWIVCLVAAHFLAASARSGAQELSAESLTKVKNATAYVKWRDGEALHMGSAYLFRKSADTGWLLSCAHVVVGTSKVELVFGSGTPKERTITAEVLAADEDADVACLRLKSADLPDVLDLVAKTDLRETENVFVAGFPFGEMLSTSSRNPDMSISKLSVSSLRKNDDGEVALVQLDGNINPGNSGGPVIDAKGRVVGMAAAKIRNTGLNFAIPPEALRQFLRGRMRSARVAPVKVDAKKARLDLRIEVLDPFGALKSVGFSWMRKADAKDGAGKGPDGRNQQVSASMADLLFKVSASLGTAEDSVELTRGEGEAASVEILFQFHWTQEDGTTVWTEPDVRTIEFVEPAVAVPNPGPNPGGVPVVPVPVAPGEMVDLQVADALTEKRRISLMSVIGDLFLSKDGAFLYALDLSEGRLLKIRTSDFKVDATLVLPGSPTCACLSPNGETIYVGIRISAYVPNKSGAGRITAVAAATMKAGDSTDFEGDPSDLEVTSGGLAIVASAPAEAAILILDLKNKTIDKVRLTFEAPTIRLHPDQERVFTGDKVGGGYFCCITLQKNSKDSHDRYAADEANRSAGLHGGEFEISPDGQFLLGSRGALLRTEKGTPGNMALVAKVDPWTSAAMAPSCSSFFITTLSGFLKQYSLVDGELKKSLKTGVLCTQLVLDLGKKMLYAATYPGKWVGRIYAGCPVEAPADLVEWSLESAK